MTKAQIAEMAKNELAKSFRKGHTPYKAISLYIDEIVENIGDDFGGVAKKKELVPLMLNGAKSWREYSFGGCSLCYDREIAERVLTPKQFDHWLSSNQELNLLAIQARYLWFASLAIGDAYNFFHPLP